MSKPLIALDGDGVLLDYNLAYSQAWSQFTGVYPVERDFRAYWPMERWGVQHLSGDRLAKFRAVFDGGFWSSIPAMAGAVDACHRLHDHGYQLVCVTALEERFVNARLTNLQDQGFPIERVYGVQNQIGPKNPKADIIDTLQPAVFVDDYLPYLAGIRSATHTAQILREPNGSPNTGAALDAVGSTLTDLAAFSRWWLTRM
jgi:phosphoglycolate phosphatase-like HAD superfamily hydrolase